jgi:hypothetical protein
MDTPSMSPISISGKWHEPYSISVYQLLNNVTNFDAPHFNYSGLFSEAQVEKIGNPQKCENCIRTLE